MPLFVLALLALVLPGPQSFSYTPPVAREKHRLDAFAQFVEAVTK